MCNLKYLERSTGANRCDYHRRSPAQRPLSQQAGFRYTEFVPIVRYDCEME